MALDMAESISGAIAGLPRLAASEMTEAISSMRGSSLEPSGSNVCLPSCDAVRTQRPVCAADSNPETAIWGAASGLFLTALKTASAIWSGVALLQSIPGGKVTCAGVSWAWVHGERAQPQAKVRRASMGNLVFMTL